MRNKILLGLILALCVAFQSLGQAPQSIPYQAVARDTAGTLLASRPISLRFSIHDTTSSGAIVYQETQTVITNVLATFTANIGKGTVTSGSFSGINWGVNAKYLQVEMDPLGGSAYINMGAQQLLSVPYAIYSNTSGTTSSSGTGSSPNTLLYTSDGF